MLHHEYDAAVNAHYIEEHDEHGPSGARVAETVGLGLAQVNLDYDREGNLIGIEVLASPKATRPAGCRYCWACLDAHRIAPMGYVLCGKCGNKRCPHAADHRLECTRSNEPGQPGATRYPASPVSVADLINPYPDEES